MKAQTQEVCVESTCVCEEAGAARMLLNVCLVNESVSSTGLQDPEAGHEVILG